MISLHLEDGEKHAYISNTAYSNESPKTLEPYQQRKVPPMRELLGPPQPSLERRGLGKAFHDGLAYQHLVPIRFTNSHATTRPTSCSIRRGPVINN